MDQNVPVLALTPHTKIGLTGVAARYFSGTLVQSCLSRGELDPKPQARRHDAKS
jgi:hypothetical protein